MPNLAAAQMTRLREYAIAISTNAVFAITLPISLIASLRSLKFGVSRLNANVLFVKEI
jgi:hypothetical protein